MKALAGIRLSSIDQLAARLIVARTYVTQPASHMCKVGPLVAQAGVVHISSEIVPKIGSVHPPDTRHPEVVASKEWVHLEVVSPIRKTAGIDRSGTQVFS
jgi:hypothetical protein